MFHALHDNVSQLMRKYYEHGATNLQQRPFTKSLKKFELHAKLSSTDMKRNVFFEYLMVFALDFLIHR